LKPKKATFGTEKKRSLYFKTANLENALEEFDSAGIVLTDVLEKQRALV